MSSFPLADKAGVTKRAIQKAINEGLSEEDLFNFVHGDVNQLHKKLPRPSGYQNWETTGKRYVHLEEARFVTKHFLRNAIKPINRRALILSGTDPALACLPWAMSGLVNKFVAYESDPKSYKLAKKTLPKEKEKIKSRLPEKKEIDISLMLGDILKEKTLTYGIIDLDFCSNRIRNKVYRSKILDLLDNVAPTTGPFVLRTTLHMGRVNNSRQDVEQHIQEFENEIRNPNPEFQSYIIRASDRSPYQSSLPMVSLVWILERKSTR